MKRTAKKTEEKEQQAQTTYFHKGTDPIELKRVLKENLDPGEMMDIIADLANGKYPGSKKFRNLMKEAIEGK